MCGCGRPRITRIEPPTEPFFAKGDVVEVLGHVGQRWIITDQVWGKTESDGWTWLYDVQDLVEQWMRMTVPERSVEGLASLNER